MSSPKKKWTRKWSFAAGVYLSKAQNPIPPLHTLYVYAVYFFSQGEGERWLEGQHSSLQSWIKIPTLLTVCPVERPDPKGLSTFSQCTEFLPHMGVELISSRSEDRRSN